MKRIITTVAIAAIVLSCKVQKVGHDTYKVVAPTPQAKAAAEKLKEKVSVAAQKTETALQKAGSEIKEKTSQKTETTETTKTERRHSKTTTYR